MSGLPENSRVQASVDKAADAAKTARRIVRNVIATCSRLLYVLVIGLFCGRWALMALGE